jgi:hypothetical protein
MRAQRVLILFTQNPSAEYSQARNQICLSVVITCKHQLEQLVILRLTQQSLQQQHISTNTISQATPKQEYTVQGIRL